MKEFPYGILMSLTLDLGDLVLEDENDALVFSREREMKRSVHAWLCFHSGLFSEWGLHRDHIDNNALTAPAVCEEGTTLRAIDSRRQPCLL